MRFSRHRHIAISPYRRFRLIKP